MSAAGEPLISYIVTSKNSSTAQEHLKQQGVRVGRHFPLKFNPKPYINTGIFLDDITTVFLSYIDTFRGLTVFA
jgi:hypothetical protein